MMKVLFFVIVAIFGVANATADGEKDHNEAEYRALCGVLNAAVNELRSGLESHSEPMRTALHRTIFGKDGGGSLDDLKSKLPGNYQLPDGYSTRPFFCGQPKQEKVNDKESHALWPGHSAPHDLLCLCTAGDGGWPLSASDAGKVKLCGKTLSDLGGEANLGWFRQQSGEKQIQATWTSVTRECLSGNGAETSLQSAMDAFKTKLKQNTSSSKHKDERLLGEGKFGDYPCGGSKQICVMYYNTTDNAKHKPWWKELEEAIKIDEQMQKTRKEETRKQKEIEKQKESYKQETLQFPRSPRTAAITSAPQGSQDAEQENPENISAPIATIEDASGTLLIHSCSWFLGVLLLI
ncbi:Variant surface glycoprotein [Trypanosoma congolense IL3000]|uniref:Variant surface glycoprotein n=1 Tax=Trypanosoma congolense (strain IL3000) TaxID=1068625 RepID=F9WJR5_TRYCI|nr:Variant surface glycoprotein [Trypanosoma congolense IL3000]